MLITKLRFINCAVPSLALFILFCLFRESYLLLFDKYITFFFLYLIICCFLIGVQLAMDVKLPYKRLSIPNFFAADPRKRHSLNLPSGNPLDGMRKTVPEGEQVPCIGPKNPEPSRQI